MAHLSLPILFLNLGGEMLYIIEQRLSAQNVPVDRSNKVMHEIIETMFRVDFIDTLFTPQSVYSKSSIKELFEKLAHSSIMKLNAASMAKLYDLMTMAVKYQVCLSRSGRQLLFVTLNHLYAITNYLKMAPTIKKLWDSALDKFLKIYEPLNMHQWTWIRRSLLNFFQDESIRVSIFLKDNIQRQNGKFFYALSGELEFGFELPGTIKSYDASGKLKRVGRFQTEEEFTVQTKKASILQNSDRMTKLGLNMYKTRKGIETQKVISKSLSSNVKSDFDTYQRDPTCRHELDLLSKLLSTSGKETVHKNVKLNLFQSDQEESNAAAQGGAPVIVVEEPESKIVMVDARKTKENAALNEVIKEMSLSKSAGGSGASGQQQDIDLLELMDQC